MFTYLSVYVLAAILLFQGINLLGELEAPTGVVPPEVRPAAARNNPAPWAAGTRSTRYCAPSRHSRTRVR